MMNKKEIKKIIEKIIREEGKNGRIRTAELERQLLLRGFFHSISTIYNRVRDWLEEGILIKESFDDRNFSVSLKR